MKIYKIEAQGDIVYVQAKDQKQAQEKLFAVMGPIPTSLLTFSEVKKLPKDEQFLAE